MSTLSLEDARRKTSHLDDAIREQALVHAKAFKMSWTKLGQCLYAIYKDKFYKMWDYEKFEHYTTRELGIKNQVAMRLLKVYEFLETDEPDYLKGDFGEDRDAVKVPGVDAVNVLRLAKLKKEITRDDYFKMKKDIFDKGKDDTTVRKDLASLIKERKYVDPEQEREGRNRAAIQRLLGALQTFKKDMAVLKIVPNSVIEEANALIKDLEKQI